MFHTGGKSDHVIPVGRVKNMDTLRDTQVNGRKWRLKYTNTNTEKVGRMEKER
jgi:hypothetical protein